MKKLKIIITTILALGILLVIPSNCKAKIYTETIEESGIKFEITMDTETEKCNVKYKGLKITGLTDGINFKNAKAKVTVLAQKMLQDKINEEKQNASDKMQDEINNATDGNKKDDKTETTETKQEERTQITEITSTTVKVDRKSLDGLSKGGIASGNNVFCIEHYNSNIPESVGKNKITVAGKTVDLSTDRGTLLQGIVIGKGSYPKSGSITAIPTQPSQGMVLNDTRYTKKVEETLGETYESAAVAYIASKVNEANDNGSGLENYMQIAIWNEDYHNLNEGKRYGKFDGGLEEEAKAYQKYREEIEKWKEKGNAVKDTIIDQTVSIDLKNREQKLRTLYSRICKRIC